MRRKAAGYAAENNIWPSAVPISRRSCTIHLNPSKTICVKWTHLPLVFSSAITIHKSQGSTYTEIIYKPDKKHPQSLLYVDLSRVTDIQCLYIVSRTDDIKFYHCRKASDSTKRLRNEFARLDNNRLEIIDRRLINFIEQNVGISIYSFDCQSLQAHFKDLSDIVLNNSKILMFSETRLSNDEIIEIPNFLCIAQYKRPNVQGAWVEIYHNTNDQTNTVSPLLKMTTWRSKYSYSGGAEIGVFYVAECLTSNKKIIIMAAVYISPN